MSLFLNLSTILSAMKVDAITCWPVVKQVVAVTTTVTDICDMATSCFVLLKPGRHVTLNLPGKTRPEKMGRKQLSQPQRW